MLNFIEFWIWKEKSIFLYDNLKNKISEKKRMIITVEFRLWCLNKGMCYKMSCFITWHDSVIWHHIVLCDITLCYMVHLMWYHLVMWHHTVLYYVTCYMIYTVKCDSTSCYMALHCIMLQLTQHVMFNTALHQGQMICPLKPWEDPVLILPLFPSRELMKL